MPRASDVLYSYCGIVCNFCKALVQGDCKGCDFHVNSCEYAKCCLSKGLRCCLECEGFPCKLHEEGFTWSVEGLGTLNWRVYSDVFLRIFKKKE